MSENAMVEKIVGDFAKQVRAYQLKGQRAPRSWGAWVIETNVRNQMRPASPDRPAIRGTRKFRGGAKVYIAGGWAGTCSSVVVAGHHRRSGRYLWCAVDVTLLENLRPRVLYSPGVARALCLALSENPEKRRTPPDVDCFFASREEAEEAISKFEAWIGLWKKPKSITSRAKSIRDRAVSWWRTRVWGRRRDVRGRAP